MSREKQIEEMAEYIYSNGITHDTAFHEDCRSIARDLYNEGYRKQSEGEWHTIVDNKNDIVTECTACKKHFWFMKKGQLNIDRMPYCPNCGAKMKGGE